MQLYLIQDDIVVTEDLFRSLRKGGGKDTRLSYILFCARRGGWDP